ncbi:hypothetical protein BDV97DRAFT_349771 [Delphinella strobiligena]|nr:hypothetical protein BDV97DRAFT_349771 [Delphinella strobiligena]
MHQCEDYFAFACYAFLCKCCSFGCIYLLSFPCPSFPSPSFLFSFSSSSLCTFSCSLFINP